MVCKIFFCSEFLNIPEKLWQRRSRRGRARSPETTSVSFSVVTVNDEHTKPTIGSKESAGVKLKEGICVKLRLKLWFESDWYFCNITTSGLFESNCPERKS